MALARKRRRSPSEGHLADSCRSFVHDGVDSSESYFDVLILDSLSGLLDAALVPSPD